jgi:HAD superfamily hydrolase (TIGR01549 family)
MKTGKLLLFDIDGTLTKGGHVEAFKKALKKVYGVDGKKGLKGSHGMMDKQIIMETLLAYGLPEKEIVSKREEAMKEMARSYKEFIRESGKEALNGARELVEELDSRGFILGLVTGNVEEIAWMKLDKVGIGRFFRFGAFGSEHTSRTTLVRMAIERAESNHGFDAEGDVFVIGDTPLDIKAGKGAGATTIGVATGVFSREELEKEGADYVLDDLTDSRKFMNIIER